MKFSSLRIQGLRCFEDTGNILLSSACNIFVGQNNAGKSTILKALMNWQIPQFSGSSEFRPSCDCCIIDTVVEEVKPEDTFNIGRPTSPSFRLVRSLKGAGKFPEDPPVVITGDSPVIVGNWPNLPTIQFAAKRKAVAFSQTVTTGAQANADGTFNHLYARIDKVASPGLPAHNLYRNAIENIVGFYITTVSAPNGKEAGYYYDQNTFVSLERMGDGVSEIVALVVELSLARGKIFILEEPETNLHPLGLKALLELIVESSQYNQFIIATHSNIVVRELGSESAKIFRVFRSEITPSSPSKVEELSRNPIARMDLLRELGYEFADFELHEGWLILEESSAETIVREVLIPWFAPDLEARLRTFSAGGATKVEPSVSDFQRLITFIHLEPSYRDRLWVRADGDDQGQEAIRKVREKFSYLIKPYADVFEKPIFEGYYPEAFSNRVTIIGEISSKFERNSQKLILLRDVLQWTKDNPDLAKSEWQSSAAEVITTLLSIQESLKKTQPRR